MRASFAIATQSRRGIRSFWKRTASRTGDCGKQLVRSRTFALSSFNGNPRLLDSADAGAHAQGLRLKRGAVLNTDGLPEPVHALGRILNPDPGHALELHEEESRAKAFGLRTTTSTPAGSMVRRIYGSDGANRSAAVKDRAAWVLILSIVSQAGFVDRTGEISAYCEQILSVKYQQISYSLAKVISRFVE